MAKADFRMDDLRYLRHQVTAMVSPTQGPLPATQGDYQEEHPMFEMKKPNKYRNIKVEIDGYVFDSKKEANRYAELSCLERAGEIKNLELQPKYEIVLNSRKICTYKADFLYIQAGRIIVEDVKGIRTAVYKLKKKLVEALYGIQIVEI